MEHSLTIDILRDIGKHSNNCTLYQLRFSSTFALAIVFTKPQFVL